MRQTRRRALTCIHGIHVPAACRRAVSNVVVMHMSHVRSLKHKKIVFCYHACNLQLACIDCTRSDGLTVHWPLAGACLACMDSPLHQFS